VLADNGDYELNNLNRQNAFLSEVGDNKAVVSARRVLAINPTRGCRSSRAGIVVGDADRLVAGCDVVIDGVDVTELSACGPSSRCTRAPRACESPS
jgi:molybdopterin/thiamine biosynthesis adenylyltransferase